MLIIILWLVLAFAKLFRNVLTFSKVKCWKFKYHGQQPWHHERGKTIEHLFKDLFFHLKKNSNVFVFFSIQKIASPNAIFSLICLKESFYRLLLTTYAYVMFWIWNISFEKGFDWYVESLMHMNLSLWRLVLEWLNEVFMFCIQFSLLSLIIVPLTFKIGLKNPSPFCWPNDVVNVFRSPFLMKTFFKKLSIQITRYD